MATSSIEWTEETWNPLTGCSKISAGCEECYAIGIAYRLMHIQHSKDKYAGTVVKTPGGQLNWTGRINYDRESLIMPLGRKKPTMFFVNSMSDLFHQDVPVKFIAEVYAVMWLTPHHTYQILTKRAKRAAEVLNSPEFLSELYKACNRLHNDHIKPLEQELYQEVEVTGSMPLKNAWFIVSVENQKAADERIPHLINIPAVVRGLSCEPLLGPLDITNHGLHDAYNVPTRLAEIGGRMVGVEWTDPGAKYIGLDWVITGGESGKKARPSHPDWIRGLRDQCAASGVSFFFKQWGEWMPVDSWKTSKVRNKLHMWPNGHTSVDVFVLESKFGQVMAKVGKHVSGNLLDGKEHKEYPI